MVGEFANHVIGMILQPLKPRIRDKMQLLNIRYSSPTCGRGYFAVEIQLLTVQISAPPMTKELAKAPYLLRYWTRNRCPSSVGQIRLAVGKLQVFFICYVQM